MANDAYTSITSITPSASVLCQPSASVIPAAATVQGQNNIYYERRKRAVKPTK